MQIFHSTGKFIGEDEEGKYKEFTLEEITSNRPTSNYYNKYSKVDFQTRINEIKQGGQLKVKVLFNKMCFLDQDETEILLQVYNEVKTTDSETAYILEFLMNKVGIDYK